MYDYIDREKYYSLNEIKTLNLIPWIKSYSTLKRWVFKDMEKDNFLHTKVIGNDKGRRYLIKGENLIEYLKKLDNSAIIL